MKKFISVLMSLLLVCPILYTGHNNARASAMKYEQVSSDATEAYYVTENGLIPLTAEELKLFNQGRKEYKQNRNKENSQKNDLISDDNSNIIIPNDLPIYYYQYLQYGSNPNRIRYDLTRTVCNPLFNATPDPSTKELSCSTVQTTTWEGSSTYTSGEKAAICGTLGASIGGSWQISKTYTETNTMTIQPNNWGWFEFTPVMYNSWGYVETFDEITGTIINRKWVDTYKPLYLNNDRLFGVITPRTSATPSWPPIY